MINALYIFLGGGLGSLSRYSISKFTQSKFNGINPEATLISNIASSLILGIFAFLLISKFSDNNFIKFFIIIGFCGGFSTFSTFSFEVFELFKSGNLIYAILYVFTSVIFCTGIIFLISKFI